MRKKLYALYMDDELLGIGTIKTLAELDREWARVIDDQKEPDHDDFDRLVNLRGELEMELFVLEIETAEKDTVYELKKVIEKYIRVMRHYIERSRR